MGAAVEAVRRTGPDFAVDDVARSAGVSKTVIYRYFTDKDELVDAVLARISNTILLPRLLGEIARDHSDDRAALRAVIAAFVALIEDEPELYRFLVQSAKHEADRSGPRLVSDIGNQIAVTLGTGLRRAGADSGAAEPWAYAIVGMTFAGAGWWLDRRSMSKDDLVGYLSQLLWSGLSGAGLGRLEQWDVDEPDGRPRISAVPEPAADRPAAVPGPGAPGPGTHGPGDRRRASGDT